MSQPSHYTSPSSSFMNGVQEGRANEGNLETLLHSYLLQVQNGRLYPEHIAVNTMESVLDLGCGTGEWIFDLARRYPKLRIYGIDSNERALHHARVRRNTSSLRQVELRQMDISQGLPIPDAFVNFVHMRTFSRYIKPQSWPSMIRECIRVLKPRGWLDIVEAELCEISSPACLTLHRAVLQAQAKLGRTLDATGNTLGVLQRLYPMLLQAGLYDVGYDVFTMDVGAMSGDIARRFLSQFAQQTFTMKPLVVQQGILESAEFNAIIEQAQKELQSPDLCGWAILLSVYGCRGENA